MLKSKLNIPHVYMYSDGSSRGNPGPGAYGVILEIPISRERKLFSDAFRFTTNNRMELWPIIVGLEYLQQKTCVKIFTDSKYITESVNKSWIFSWERTGFKGKKNSDLWLRFLNLYRIHQVSFIWIKGHNHHSQNEECDDVAYQASKNGPFKIDEFYEDLQK